MSLYLAFVTLILTIDQWNTLTRVHRSAWTGAAIGLATQAVFSTAFDLGFGILIYFHCAATLAIRKKIPQVLYLVSVGALILGETLNWDFQTQALLDLIIWKPSFSSFLCFCAGLAAASFNQRLIITSHGLRLRIAMYWFTFITTFFVLIPAQLAKIKLGLGLFGQVSIHSFLQFAFCFLFAALAVWIWRLTTQALRQAAGTPDPNDATQKLQVAGIYSRVRHPMQLGHFAAVISSALFFGTWNNVCYALGFIFFSVTLLRSIEEGKLAAKFGDGYRQYHQTTPAYWPRVSPIKCRDPGPSALRQQPLARNIFRGT